LAVIRIFTPWRSGNSRPFEKKMVSHVEVLSRKKEIGHGWGASLMKPFSIGKNGDQEENGIREAVFFD
jgi:hypothetical protein